MMDDQKNNTFSETVKQLAKRLEKLLFEPSARITDERDRLRAYVSAILLFVVTLVFLYGVSRTEIGAPAGPGTPSWATLALSLLMVFGGYVLSRTRYYQWGLGVVFIPMLVISYGLVFNPPPDFSGVEQIARWLVLPLLLAALLLPQRVYSLIALVFMGVPVSLIFVLPGEVTQTAISMAVFLIMSAVLIGLSARFQARLETQALSALQDKNLAEKEGIIEQLQQAEALQKQRARVIEASYEINSKLATILDPQQLIGEVINQIQTLFNYNYVQLYLVDESEQNLVVAGGTGEAGQLLYSRGHHIPVGKGLVGQAAATNIYVLVEDVSQIDTWVSNALLPNTKSELAVPISVGDKVLGVLDVQHDEEGALGAEDVALLQSVGTAVAIALQNARLYEDVNKRAEQEAIVNQINQQILSAPDIERILQVTAQELGRTLKAKNTTVQLTVRQNGSENGRNSGERI